MAGFTSIAPDHAIEHENRAIKVIVGIAQHDKALDKLFLIALEMSKLLDELTKEYGMDSNASRTQHHEMTGGKLSRITKNATKFTGVFVEERNPFTADEDDMYNLLTREVMNEKVTKDILGS